MDYFKSLEFSELVQNLLKLHHVPGVSIAIVQDGQIATLALGLASLEDNTSCTTDTLFDIASSSKSFTAGAIALLIDDEAYPEIQWEATMSSLLPDDFVGPNDEFTKNVTVEDMLAHRTGMGSHDSAYLGAKSASPDTAKSITRNLRNLPIVAPFRTRYLYTNLLYTAATYLIEVKTETTFSTFLEDHIFNPLDMTSTALQPSTAQQRGNGHRIATGYCWDKDSASYRSFQSPDCPEGQGAGSIITSASDLILWVKAVLYKEQPINDRVYNGLTKMRSFVNPSARRLKPFSSPPFYSAGMEVSFYRGHMAVGHDGCIPGFSSRFSFMPDHKFGVVVLGNSSTATAVANSIIRELMDDILSVPVSERPRPQLPNPKKMNAKKPKNGLPIHLATASTQETVPSSPKWEPKTPQERSLSDYIGSYYNNGYKALNVTIVDDELFVDASDRSLGFSLTFQHSHDQTHYIAHLSDYLEGGDELIDAEFVFENNKIVRLGLQFEPALQNLIWFDKQE